MKTSGKDLKKEIREERRRNRNEPMWFFDEPEELWRKFREEARPLEREHLEIRTALRDAEAVLRACPEDEHMAARVKYLTRRLSHLETVAPWLSSEVPVEILLWGVPHG
ncbi:MAG TPA: hypothetical protein VJ386_11655 [Candidatus Deferrimicrobiaceae bacterium]|nr:hypothetical protein [Candidatus Deferrimicrobiaceae bacterium]